MTKTKTLTLLIASAALTAAVGLPAWSALHQAVDGGAATSLSSLVGGDQSGGITIIAEGDDQENEGATAIRSHSSGDEDSCEEGENNCGSAANPPAAAGTVPPPQNGLFGTAPAKVQVK